MHHSHKSDNRGRSENRDLQIFTSWQNTVLFRRASLKSCIPQTIKNMLQSNPYCTPQVKSSRYRSIKSVVAALFNIYFSSWPYHKASEVSIFSCSFLRLSSSEYEQSVCLLRFNGVSSINELYLTVHIIVNTWERAVIFRHVYGCPQSRGKSRQIAVNCIHKFLYALLIEFL